MCELWKKIEDDYNICPYCGYVVNTIEATDEAPTTTTTTAPENTTTDVSTSVKKKVKTTASEEPTETVLVESTSAEVEETKQPVVETLPTVAQSSEPQATETQITETTLCEQETTEHEHNWVYISCEYAKCNGCDTEVYMPNHTYDLTTGICSKCNQMDPDYWMDGHHIHNYDYINYEEAYYTSCGYKEEYCSICHMPKTTPMTEVEHDHCFTDYNVFYNANVGYYYYKKGLVVSGVKFFKCQQCGYMERVVNNDTLQKTESFNEHLNTHGADTEWTIYESVLPFEEYYAADFVETKKLCCYCLCEE